MSRVEQHRHHFPTKWFWLIGLLVILAFGGILFGSADSVRSNTQLSTSKVSHRQYILNQQSATLYRLSGSNQQPKRQILHKVSGSQTWTRTKKVTVQDHNTPRTYYFVNNGHGKAGWILPEQLLPAEIHLNVTPISQRPELPTGCEITATTMMLRYAGAKVNKVQMAKAMPRSTDPDQGFVGDPFSDTTVGMYVYPGGLMSLVKHELGSAKNMTGASLIQVKRQLARRHPVTAWVVNLDGFATHCITLSGYSATRIYYSDPWTGKKESLPVQEFIQDWELNARRALSY